MKIRTLLFAFGFLGALSIPAKAQALEATQAFEFPFHAGDSVIIQNDYGHIRVEPSSSDTVEISIRRMATSQDGLNNVSVVCQKVGPRIYVQAYFYRYSAESVFIRIHAPRALDVVAWGANPAVDLQNMGGLTRVQTLTGFITAANLTGSVSLFTESGDIEYRAAVQPQNDLLIETIKGNIRCELRKNLCLRGWLRAGDRLSWGGEVASNPGFLERQLGEGGPLLLASSQAGTVGVELLDGPPLQTQAAQADTVSRGNPGKALPPDPSQASGNPASPVTRRTPTTETEPNGPLQARTTEAAPLNNATTGDSGDYSLKVDVNLVNVNASVRDRSTNRAVADLTRDDFEVYEDGRSQTIAQFDNTEAPFSLLLLLDVSGSTESYLRLVQSASIQFTQQIKVDDAVALATFNSRTELRQPFTNDRRVVEQAIRNIGSGGGTAFYDALSRSVTEYFKGVEGRKAIVVFTDGVDNQLTGDYSHGSSISFGDLFHQIKEEDILIYTIFLDTEGGMSRLPGPIPRRTSGSLGGILGSIILGRGGGGPVFRPGNVDPQVYQEARGELEQIADQTGGRLYSPRSIDDLSGSYDEIAQDLRVQYTLGYYSSNARKDGRWRDIRVAVPNRPGLVARYRRGYYGSRK